ncbi:Multidrug resistance protein MdtN [Legionella massiliensis]|uniref:Multidrug resistance protein MdtN n=1 Tax=Legionella massiliensis TaxID=1034943 RepID=A0A078KX19_9GAMM|nr:efflux RND transporter periplasmic adaptor subunit [Legionella massiliensis]CDZ78955.1 Multidrug resistance protein MdtN [Legionella massiliensis]CEE14693.1 Multidrug resistance protein MdtN [Legionella massiliensis]
MKRIFKVSKNEINLPIIVIVISIIIGIYHIFSYMIPFTSHAFVVTNVTPIAADVSGFITDIHVRNGSAVKKDDPLFEVYREPYRLAYESAKAKYEEAIERFKVIERQTQKTRTLFEAAKYSYDKAKFEYQLKNAPSVREALSKLEVKKLDYDLHTIQNKMDSLLKQIAVEDQQLVQQKKLIAAFKAEERNAKVNLNLTLVRAPADGVVDNLYIGPGTPVEIHKPLFSFIDTSTWWIQANLYETDLRHVRPGDKVYIMLRMYYFNKIFHGEIVNTIWAADRQTTDPRTQVQKISSDNQWLLEPQRFPIQIKILDPDPKYPLHPGASAYVYIKTR